MLAHAIEAGDILARGDTVTEVTTTQEADLLGPITQTTVTTEKGRTHAYNRDQCMSVRRGGRPC